MAFEMTANQQTTVTLTATDKKGNPATVTDVAWMVDNPAVLALSSESGDSTTVSAVGPLTTPNNPAILSVTADADLGAGVVQLAGTLEIGITGGQAVQVIITPAQPVDQP